MPTNDEARGDTTRGDVAKGGERSELRQLFDSLVDPILSIDAGGRILNANPAVEQTFGYSREEIQGKNISLLMAEPYRSEHDHYIRRFLETGERRAIGRVRQVLARRKSGTEFPCELSVSMVRVGSDLRFYGIARDVSDREDLMARFAQVERLAAVGELAAGVAHEVNNPVNTIINCAKLIKDGDDDPQLLDDIVDEGLRIAMIVRDLLDFSREHAQGMTTVDLAEVVQRTMALLRKRVAKEGIEFVVDLEEDLPRIRGRAHQIQQVLMNVLLNARDALKSVPERENRQISLKVRSLLGRGEVEIRIHDNGPGIEEHDIERIFRPFYSRKLGKGGTGLGLAVSRGIVEDHEGSIAAHSEYGVYAEFVIVLPLLESATG